MAGVPAGPPPLTARDRPTDRPTPSGDLVVHARGPRPTLPQLVREAAELGVALPLFAVSPLLRPWHRRWGATDAEVEARMPGDDLVPGCQYRVTRAITIRAAPEAVWPWIVQMGFGNAGFYAYDLLDNFGRASAVDLLEDRQRPSVGDWVPMFTTVNDVTAFRIARLEPPRVLLWTKPDSSWVWTLTPRNGGTRLVTRLRILYRWHRPGEAVFSLLLNEFGDFPMMRKMLLTIRRRAESRARTAAGGK